MKFGGTSLRDEDCRSYALKHIKNYHESGERIVVVVSAMGRKGEPYATDTLVALLRDVGHNINPRELDLVMSVGETLSSAYFSHLLSHNGMPAESFNGRQSGILTDDNAGNAEILDINPARIVEALDNGFIAVVAGFQGVNDKGDIRTLGRGGSDTSAVALASALGAEKVEIFSDVDGIANCDPRQVEGSSYLESISVNQMLAMADEGSRVIHPRAIKASLKTQTPIIAKNTFNDSEGTLIHHDISKKKEVVDKWDNDNIASKEVTEADAEKFYKSGVLRGKKYFGKEYDPANPKNKEEEMYTDYVNDVMERYHKKIKKNA